MRSDLPQTVVTRRDALTVARSAVLGAFLVALVWPTHALGDDYSNLGKFERETVNDALQALELTLEPKPEGKVLDRIWVWNGEVFSKRDAFLQWFNIFHRTTRQGIIEREVLLRPGMVWDRELVDESVRRIRGPEYSNVVAIFAVKHGKDPAGKFDLLVVTRDLWSLRLNSNFDTIGDELTMLTFSLAENNFLGWRKKLALTFFMDQGTIQLGPRYFDPNIAGSRLTLATAANVILRRSDGGFEGTASATALEYPLWALDRHWGGAVSVGHFDGVLRNYLGTSLALVGPSEDEQYEWKYEYQSISAEAAGVYGWGDKLKQRISWGYSVFRTSAAATDDFPGDEAQRELFEATELPRSELSSALFVSYRAFTPHFHTYRDMRTYDLREDRQLGPDFSYRATQGLTALGSDTNYLRLSAGFTYAFDPGLSSYIRLGASWSGRLQEKDLIDQLVVFGFYGFTPMLWKAIRVVARFEADMRLSETQNRSLAIGAENGLRGYVIGAFRGLKRLRANLEVRSTPWRFYFLRVGGLVFWDLGGANDSWDDLKAFNSVGLGLRILIPQINTLTSRFDLAFPLQGESRGIPVFSMGFDQAF